MKKFFALFLLGLVMLIPPLLPATASATGTIALGVYQPQADTTGAAIDKYIKGVGRTPAFAWQPTKWQRDDGSYVAFKSVNPILEEYRTRGIMPGINWDASKGSAYNTNQPDFSWKAIASGKHDAYITNYAKAAAAYHYPFVIRLLEEMNGNWFPWGYSVNGNTNPADFVAAWKHIVNIYRQQRATNVKFVWCLAGGVLTENKINQYRDTLKQFYPGDNYVDWVSLDGYADLSSNDLRSLQGVFKPSYQFVTSISKRPLMFSEVGATENPSDAMAKANWITQGFLTTIPTQFPGVKVVNWFNSKSDQGSKNYAVDTSENSRKAWSQVVASPLYRASFPK